ncbi:PREDICTED: pentatricopeptide repeat-containing protein At1g71490-like [Erythranthe guttata]|uniref:pentatricopeptide repeat-containing protein At1g71490-like n=1 Tax=Erythranthe guttata TaxID=4155 RepID=UPI00064DECF5|nr:PREDICTED: pentatricopeptide repeat-containing protein At1g71490-like [Erythranthe guttata]|eukprot:XP_012837532.1 PREDICTED: pentatricopeptide repeat-containing protein At1g71490-like [Erythranthe guttata]
MDDSDATSGEDVPMAACSECTKTVVSRQCRRLPRSIGRTGKLFWEVLQFIRYSILPDEKIDNCLADCLAITLKDSARKGRLFKALSIFSLIQSHALASSAYPVFVVDSLSSLLLSCANLESLPLGKQLHAQVITWGLHKSHALVPKLVSFYATFGFINEAHFIAADSNILHPLPWNVLISSYVSEGRYDEAIFAYKEMGHKRVVPDRFTYPSVLKACAEQSNLEFGREVHELINATSSLKRDLFVQNALVSMYGKCGDLETARSIFEEIPDKDEFSWNSIISLYASRGGCLRIGNFAWALKLMRQMRTGGVRCR